ncbi:50S ribosomal protein L6 [archaeon]|nr:50S ribosomal protein L6 [archaeon]
MKPQRTLNKTITIPEKTTATLVDTTISIEGPKGKLEREFYYPSVSIKVADNTVAVSGPGLKKAKRMMNTFTAHITNMIKGVNDGFHYQLKICAGHFPVNVTKEQSTIMIKNFLGEKIPRQAQIVEGVEVEIKEDLIDVTGISKEAVGQTAANLEQATKIRNRDRRRFQDGIFIIEKDKEAEQ